MSWWEVLKQAEKGIEESEHIGGRKKQTTIYNRSLMIWKRPRTEAIKLNVNGAVDSLNGVYGIGAKCRDENGACLGVLAVPGVNM